MYPASVSGLLGGCPRIYWLAVEYSTKLSQWRRKWIGTNTILGIRTLSVITGQREEQDDLVGLGR